MAAGLLKKWETGAMAGRRRHRRRFIPASWLDLLFTAAPSAIPD